MDIMLLPSALDGHLKGNEQTLNIMVTVHIIKSIKTIICGAFHDIHSVCKDIGFDDQKLIIDYFLIKFFECHSILTKLIVVNWIHNNNPFHLKLTAIIPNYV
jgi:hypothetical protein